MRLAIIALLAAMVSIQSGASLAKQVFPFVGAPGATAFRLAFAAIILYIVWRPWRHPMSFADWKAIAKYGAVLGIMNLAFYLALDRIPLGVAVTLEFTGPLALALILSRKLVDFLWAALAIAGIILIFPRAEHATALDSALDPVGVLFALLAGVCWALYIVFGQRISTTLPSGAATAMGMLVATMVAAPIAFAMDPGKILDVQPSVIGILLGVALLSSALPYTLEMVALKRMPAKVFSIFMSVEPAISALIALLILGERLLFLQWCAIACVVVASLGSAMSVRTPPVLRDA